MVAAREVENPARHPAPQRHANQRGHDHGTHQLAAALGRKVLTHDDRVGRHDAALEQAEQHRDDVERHQAIEGQEQQQRDALQRGSQQQGAHATDAVAHQPKPESADDAASQHQRQHARALGGAVSEVRAVGNDVHLRHRHGHAACQAGHAHQRRCLARCEPERPVMVRSSLRSPRHRLHDDGRAPPHGGRQHQHAHAANDAQRQVGWPPAHGFDASLYQRWPDRAGQVVAARAHRHGDAAAPMPPQRRIGQQRGERGCAAQHAHGRVRQAEGPQVARQAGRHVATQHSQGTEREHGRQAMTVGHPAGPQPSQPQADHHQRVGQRRTAAARAELSLHDRQHHGQHVHAAVAQHDEDERHEQAAQRLGRVDERRVRGQGRHMPRHYAGLPEFMPAPAAPKRRAPRRRTSGPARPPCTRRWPASPRARRARSPGDAGP